MSTIDVQLTITASDGTHNLEDEANGYFLHPDSLGSRATTQRTVMLDSDWADGSVALRATRANVVETVAVWCEADDRATFRARWNALKSWMNQLHFTVQVFEDGVLAETWTCPQPAEYTEDLNQTFRLATRGLLRAQVSRLPFGGG